MSFCGNLKGTNIYCRDQLPSEMNDRAVAQVKKMKELKEEDGNNRVNLVRDKLILNGEIVEPHFSANKIVIDCNLDPDISLDDITQTEPTILDNSVQMKGYYYEAEDLSEVKTVLATVQCDEEAKDASHIIYAYNLGETDGHYDDHEYGVSYKVLQFLKHHETKGVIVICKIDGKKKIKVKDRDKEIEKIINVLLDE